MICESLAAEKHAYSIVEVSPASTGLCAVTVNNVDRTCIAILEACEHYPESHMKQTMESEMMKNCICTYSTGFFIESNYEALCLLAEQSAEQNKIFGFNLASEEISKTHYK